LKVTELDKQVRYNYQIPKNIQGVLVVNVENNSKADKMGFQRGDVIIQINSQHIKSLEDYDNALKNLKKGIIYVQRRNFVIPLAYTAGKNK